MDVLDNQAVGDAFPGDGASGAVLGPIFDSNGGYYNVTGNPVYAQYAYGRYGEYYWSEPVPIPVGPAILQPGTVGVRFRNYAAGQAAAVSGSLSEHGEPAVQITSGGTASQVSAGLVKLDSITLGVLAASIGFPTSGSGAIAAGYSRLLVTGVLRGDNAGADIDVHCRINGDAGAGNYKWQRVQGSAAAAGAAADGGADTSWQIGFCPAAAAPVSEVMPLEMWLPNPQTGGRAAFLAHSFEWNGVAEFMFAHGGSHELAGVIATLLFFPAAGNFVPGSTLSLYGLT